MTEAEWLACEDSLVMLNFVRESVSDRKLRLLVVACAQKFQFLHQVVDRLLLVIERHADGLESGEDLKAARIAASDCHWSGTHGAFAPRFLAEPSALRAATYTLGMSNFDSKKNIGFLRDIFGNPFRPVAFSPLWRTDTTVSLARGMYESRDFGAMPILADALQDAGCDDDDILSHCRSDGWHVRGCWVVDLVPGKE